MQIQDAKNTLTQLNARHERAKTLLWEVSTLLNKEPVNKGKIAILLTNYRSEMDTLKKETNEILQFLA